MPVFQYVFHISNEHKHQFLICVKSKVGDSNVSLRKATICENCETLHNNDRKYNHIDTELKKEKFYSKKEEENLTNR